MSLNFALSFHASLLYAARKEPRTEKKVKEVDDSAEKLSITVFWKKNYCVFLVVLGVWLKDERITTMIG